MGRIVDAFTSDGPPSHTTNPVNYRYPYAEDLRSRYLGIIDGYLKGHGLDKYIPADRMPYELRSPDQQAQIRQQEAAYQTQNGDPRTSGDSPVYSPADAPPPPLYDFGTTAPAAPPPAIRQPDSVAQAPKYLDTDQYPQSALATALAARRAGITQTQPMFATPREYFEADQQRKQEELGRLQNYIYGDRQYGSQ